MYNTKVRTFWKKISVILGSAKSSDTTHKTIDGLKPTR